MNLKIRLLVSAVYCAGAAAVSAVTITSNSVGVRLQSSAGNGSAFFTGTSIPSSHLLDVTRGEYYSRAQIDYTGSGDNVTLMNTLDHKRSGNLNDASQGHDGSTLFTVETNSTYSLSGDYSVTDVSTASFAYIFSQLYDVTTNTYLFYDNHYSFNTLNESFELGVTGGDTFNLIFGSLTGTLIAGHQYMWLFESYTQARTPNGGATGTGFFRLDIGGGAPTTVPDGGITLAMLGLTVLSLGVCRPKVARA